MQLSRTFFFWTLLLFSQWVLAAQSPDVIDLSGKNWEYRWGDSPFQNHQPLWGNESSDSQHWKSIGFPSNPEGRKGQTNIWYRVVLPHTLPKDPHIYIYSIDLITQVYIDGHQIYHFGDFDSNGQGHFQGWPWHLIPLPDDAAGKPIYFRIFSDYPDIGLWGEVMIASKGYHLERMMRLDTPYVIGASIATFLGFIFIIGYFFQLRKIEFMLLGGLFLFLGLEQAFSTKVIQLYFDYPHTKQYILAFAYIYLAFGMAAFLERILGPGHFNLIRRAWQVHLLFLILSISGALLGFYAISDVYRPFDYLFYFITWPVLTIVTLLSIKKSTPEAKTVIIGFMVISAFRFYSTLISWNLLPWAEGHIHIPVFLCLLMFGYVLIKRVTKTDEITRANEQLNQAQEELITLNKELESRVIEEIEKRQQHEHLLMQQSKMATMGEMVGAIAHQLSQPLTAMSLVIDDAKDEIKQYCDNTTVLDESMGRLKGQIHHMGDTIHHFRNFLKPSTEQVVFKVRDMVEDVKVLLKSQLRHDQIELTIEPYEHFECIGYPNEIRQVIMNIINNAKDIFLEKNIEERNVTISFTTDENMGTIRIKDNAGGIPDELLPDKLFQAYVTTKGDQGTGIGLQLSRTIIENRMNGKIWAHNINGGAEFVIELPLAK